MPDPWPAAPTLPKPRLALAPRRRQTRRPWLPFSMRFAVAASVALLVIGYLALAGRFSSQGPGERGAGPKSDIANQSGSGQRPPSLKGLQGPPPPRVVIPGQNGGRISVERTSSPGPRGPILKLRLQLDP